MEEKNSSGLEWNNISFNVTKNGSARWRREIKVNVGKFEIRGELRRGENNEANNWNEWERMEFGEESIERRKGIWDCTGEGADSDSSFDSESDSTINKE